MSECQTGAAGHGGGQVTMPKLQPGRYRWARGRELHLAGPARWALKTCQLSDRVEGVQRPRQQLVGVLVAEGGDRRRAPPARAAVLPDQVAQRHQVQRVQHLPAPLALALCVHSAGMLYSKRHAYPGATSERNMRTKHVTPFQRTAEGAERPTLTSSNSKRAQRGRGPLTVAKKSVVGTEF